MLVSVFAEHKHGKEQQLGELMEQCQELRIELGKKALRNLRKSKEREIYHNKLKYESDVLL